MEIQQLNNFLINNWPIFTLMLLWTAYWKGMALWKAAKKGDLKWFIAILIINTIGVLEILYIYLFSKKREN
ncbi:MAG: DUF5652 family protein [Candidatus Pacebacteria bacterium]|nr:DUF5652 family protein [Candidatus Paceibacterota bacterium]